MWQSTGKCSRNIVHFPTFGSDEFVKTEVCSSI